MSVNDENPIPKPNTGDDLPDWLRELRGNVPPSSPAEPEKPEAPADDGDELPAWLQDSAEEAEATAETTDTVPEAEEEIPLPEAAADDEPDADGEALWQQILAEEGISLEDVSEERPDGVGDMSVADWMAATADESAKRQAKAQAAPPPVEPEPEPEAAVEMEDDGIVEADDLPDWLREDQPAAEVGTPDWLLDESVSSDEMDEMAVEAEVEAGPEMEAEAAFELEDDGIVEADDLPDWLREDQPAAEVGTPDWLLDESVSSDETEEMAVEAEVEAELESVEDFEPVAEAADDGFDETAFMDNDGLPDWMLEESVAPEAPAGEAIESQPEAVEGPVEVGVEAEADEIVDMDSLPDWLKEAENADEIPPEDQQIPSWLAETAREQGVADIIDIEAEADNLEIPEWLQAATGADNEAVDELPEEAEVGNLPVWLNEPSPEAIEPTDEATVEAEPIESVAAETPGWIEQLRQEDTHAPDAETLEEIEQAPVEADVRTEPEPAIAADLGEISAPEDKLAIAQAAFKAADVDEALAVLQILVEKSESLNEVIDLLQQYTESYADHAALFELLGDAQLRDGQLNQALHNYRQALDLL